MMENARPCDYGTSPPGYDLEFYNFPTVSTRGWKEATADLSGSINNNSASNNLMPLDSFSINVSTGESDLLIEELMELADENASSSSSSMMSTPSPVFHNAASSSRPVLITTTPQLQPLQQMQHHCILERVQSQDSSQVKPLYASAPTTLPYYSKLHEALTQPPRLPTHPVKCNRCGNELTSRCLMQTCVRTDETSCRQCGKDLTAKCILAVCTVEPKAEDSVVSQQKPPPGAPRRRVHHYSTPS
jgi:hypothetical protein